MLVESSEASDCSVEHTDHRMEFVGCFEGVESLRRLSLGWDCLDLSFSELLRCSKVEWTVGVGIKFESRHYFWIWNMLEFIVKKYLHIKTSFDLYKNYWESKYKERGIEFFFRTSRQYFLIRWTPDSLFHCWSSKFHLVEDGLHLEIKMGLVETRLNLDGLDTMPSSK